MKRQQGILTAWWFPLLLAAIFIWFTCKPEKTELSHANQPQAPAETAAEPQRIDVEAVTSPAPTENRKKPDASKTDESSSDAPETQKGMQSAEDYQTEEKLQSLFKEHETISKSADLIRVECEGNTCRIEAEARKDNDDGFQMLFVNFLEKHPEYGTRLKINPNAENPRLVTFTFIRE